MWGVGSKGFSSVGSLIRKHTRGTCGEACREACREACNSEAYGGSSSDFWDAGDGAATRCDSRRSYYRYRPAPRWRVMQLCASPKARKTAPCGQQVGVFRHSAGSIERFVRGGRWRPGVLLAAGIYGRQIGRDYRADSTKNPYLLTTDPGFSATSPDFPSQGRRGAVTGTVKGAESASPVVGGRLGAEISGTKKATAQIPGLIRVGVAALWAAGGEGDPVGKKARGRRRPEGEESPLGKEAQW